MSEEERDNEPFDYEASTKFPEIKFVKETGRTRKRRRHVKKDDVDNIQIRKQYVDGVELAARFNYKDGTTKKHVMFVPHPNLQTLFKQFQKKYPEASAKQLKTAVGKYVKRQVARKIKQMWRKNAPQKHTIELPDQIYPTDNEEEIIEP